MTASGEEDGIPPPPPSGVGRRLLSRRMAWICVAVSILIFVIWEGMHWRRADTVDAAAWWSYAVIPPIVAAALIYEKKLRFLPWVLGTLEVTAWKFCATYVYAQTMWMVSPPNTRVRPEPVIFEEVHTEPKKPVDPNQTGSIEGRLTRDGAPVRDAIVYVDGGLEHFLFEPPSEPLRIETGTESMGPGVWVGQVGQVVEARSLDRKLHTLIASTSEGDVFSIPLHNTGAWSSAKLRSPAGLATLRCGVHKAPELAKWLLIVTSPFWTTTNEAGEFQLQRVPAARVHVAALDSDQRSAGAETTVVAGRAARVALSW
jgi:hypothetical protein